MLPEALIQQFLKFKYGMFLFFGQTGAGKSTSLASLLQERARQRHERIITLEDPVEFIIDDKLPTLVVQRMKNEHFDSFQEAIHICLRQAPDIVLVGEIRDSKTAEIALGLAENGHIVVATIHAPVAAHAIARYIEMVGPDMSAHARSTLASVPLLIAGQRLLRHPDEPKRVPIHEVLWSTDAIAHHIRENNLHMINQAMQTGRKLGMQSFDHSIIERIEQEMLPRNMMPRNQLATS
jgi:twitching motility protein PilT